MQPETPQTPQSSTGLTKSDPWQQIFQKSAPQALSDETLWPQADTSYLKELGREPRLLNEAVQAALAHGAWHFIRQVIHEGFVNACPPSILLASTNFVAPITAADRPLSDTENEKISLWRSVLVANPWHTIELSAKERGDWKKLSHAALDALARSSSPGNTFSNPGHLIHIVDAVNVAINALRHGNAGPLDDVRVGLREAVSRMVECAGQTKTALHVTSGALQSLNLPLVIQEREVRIQFLAGIQEAKDKTAARSLLHHLASQDGPTSHWVFRVSAVSKLLSASPAPVSTMFGVLADAKDPAVRSFAMKAISHHLQFPLSRDIRAEVAHLGPVGGRVLSLVLAGLDQSHRHSGWFDGLPLLVRQYAHAAAAAHVDSGIDQDVITSLSVSNGGPLSENQVFEALVAFDPISLEGLATKIRRIIRL